MVSIRPVTPADYEAVADVHVRTWRAGYSGIIPQDYLASLDPAAFAERYRTRERPAGAQTLIAEEDGRAVGFVSFGPGREDPRTGQVYAIYVAPEHWRRGTGRELFTAARTALAGDGYTAVRLWVLEENDRARRFYERMGLAPDGARDTYTPDGTAVELPEVRYAGPL
jgi:ribosomal protein S18 acetylase RimI-like enzyme